MLYVVFILLGIILKDEPFHIIKQIEKKINLPLRYNRSRNWCRPVLS